MTETPTPIVDGRRRITGAALRSLAFVVLFLAALGVRAARAQSSGDGDEAAIRRYTLTMPKVEAWIRASRDVAAAAQAKAKAMGDSVQDDDSDDDAGGDESIDGMAARLARHPEVKRALEGAGLTPREFALVSLTLMQAMMADALLQKYPNAKHPDNLNPANLAFVKANRAQLEAKMAQLKSEGGEN